jgi:hypothetical protein
MLRPTRSTCPRYRRELGNGARMIQTADEQSPRAVAVRVVVVDSARSGVAYPRLSDCIDVDVIGQVPG